MTSGAYEYLAVEAGLSVADKVESTILGRIALLADRPGLGHWRRDLTTAHVKFFSVYSYLVVYRPETKPLEIVAILHGRRDVGELLQGRL